jgi:hypothetical protein
MKNTENDYQEPDHVDDIAEALSRVYGEDDDSPQYPSHYDDDDRLFEILLWAVRHNILRSPDPGSHLQLFIERLRHSLLKEK